MPEPQPNDAANTPGLPPGFATAPRSKMPSDTEIRQMAQERGLDPDIISRQVMQESRENPNAVSKKGAIGPMQLMPKTAAALGVDPHDPVQNLHGGMSYMQQLLTKYDGDYEKALAAYDAGPHAVDEHGGVPPYPETQDYVNKILREGEVSKHEAPKTAATGLPAGFSEAPAPVSLPKQADQTAETGVMANVRDFATELWNKINPVTAVKGAATLVNHPVATYMQDANNRQQVFNEAEDAFKKSNYSEGAAKLLYSFIPFMGPQLNEAANQALNGEYAKSVGASVGMGLNIAAPKYVGAGLRLAAKALQVPAELAEYSPRTPGEMATGEGQVHPASAAQGPINRSMGAAVRDVRYGDPSRALIDNSISSLTTAGRLEAVTSKISEFEPQLSKALDDAAADGEHPRVDVVKILSPIVEKTTEAINKSFETPAAKAAAHQDLNALWMNALEMAPDGMAEVNVANKIKQGIGDAVNWEKRPTPMMHHVELAYRDAYGAFKNRVDSIVPEVADLNDNLSNLYSARNALSETALRNAAGTGPLSGMGVTQRLEAAAGHVLPGAINATQAITDIPARAGSVLERFANATNDIRLSDLTQNPFVKNPEAGVLKIGPNASGESAASQEAINRPGVAYKIGPSGFPTYLGKDIDTNLKPGEAVIRVLPDGTPIVHNTNGLTDEAALALFKKKQLKGK